MFVACRLNPLNITAAFDALGRRITISVENGALSFPEAIEQAKLKYAENTQVQAAYPALPPGSSLETARSRSQRQSFSPADLIRERRTGRRRNSYGSSAGGAGGGGTDTEWSSAQLWLAESSQIPVFSLLG